jgi:hypothetical protein
LESLYDNVIYNQISSSNKYVKRADELSNQALDGQYG